MTYLTRLSFLPTGRRIGHLAEQHPSGAILDWLRGLVIEAAAVVAAGLARRGLSQSLGARTGEPLTAAKIDRLVVARIGQCEWVTKDDTASARLYRPRGHSLSDEQDATYAIALPTYRNAANPSDCSGARRVRGAQHTRRCVAR